jgi:hypothetical protein
MTSVETVQFLIPSLDCDINNWNDSDNTFLEAIAVKADVIARHILESHGNAIAVHAINNARKTAVDLEIEAPLPAIVAALIVHPQFDLESNSFDRSRAFRLCAAACELLQ